MFAGFSFNDVVLTQIADEVLRQTARQGGGEPQHIAIIGLPDEEQYTAEMRKGYLEPYGAEALFYPVAGADHSALQVLLDSLAPAPGVTVVTVAAAPPAARVAPALFVHETTEDEKFTGRADALARLNRWAADPGVRLIAISAVGGLGKTALAGRWLRSGKAAAARPCDGLLFWSFYREREPKRFFEALMDFGREKLGWKPKDAKAPSGVQALELLASRRLIVALDGLEVIQETPGTVAYGKLLEIDLADFLHGHCLLESGSLLALTSRFPFPDLTPYLGGALRSLPLPSLEPAEGAGLLAAVGVSGRAEDREEISRRLDGHPLALRVFARSMPAEAHGDPTRLSETVLLEGPLEAKMGRLLNFYEKQLPEAHRQALGLVALFRAPVGEATLAPLWERLLGKPGGDGSLHAALEQLRLDHLLTADPGEDGRRRYACHPILRDHFRGRVLRERRFAREAAGLIAGPPEAAKTRSREAVQIVATAIEVLLEAGDVKAANDLYRSRLQGPPSVFLTLPAPHWGMEVAHAFVRDEARHEALTQQLGARYLSFYLNEVALYANDAGEPQTALEFYQEGADIDRREGDHRNLSIGLQNVGDTELSVGLLAKAAGHLAEALELATKINDDGGKRNRLGFSAYAASLRGDVEGADAGFSQANAIENPIHHEGADLYGPRGVMWGEHLLRTGHQERARRLTEANRRICDREGAQGDIARCEWILGWLDALEGRWAEARAHLSKAKATFTAGHMIQELARVFLTEAACDLGQRKWESPLAACDRALQLGAPRGYRLIQADALNLRARVMMERPAPDPGRARDDAEAALQLAEASEYAWAQRDALELLARAHRGLGNEDEALRCQQRADEWNRRLHREPSDPAASSSR